MNNKQSIICICLVLGISFVISTTSVTYAQKNIPEKSSTKRLESQDPGKDNIYGWQIMTDYERDTYKQQIITLKKQTELDLFLLDHRARMINRAKEKGIVLRDTPTTSSQNISSGSSPLKMPNDMSKPSNDNATSIRPGTGSGPYK